MQGIESGYVVAGRYVVSEVLQDWIEPEIGVIVEAIDAILDQPVNVYLTAHDEDADVLDAARRAALLVDPRLPSIVDVGEDAALDYIVTEASGRRWLSTALAHGPLASDVARAVVGEVAEALDHAGQRGIHHGRLTPESISVDDEGRISVHGVGIDAALAGATIQPKLVGQHASAANRADAGALIALLYAANTGHWPSPEGFGAIPAAPLRGELPVPVSELNPEAEAGIDTFVSDVVRARERGPSSPNEVAVYLSGWDPAAVSRLLDLPAEAAPPQQAASEPGAGPEPETPQTTPGVTDVPNAGDSGAGPGLRPAQGAPTPSPEPRPKVRLRAPATPAEPAAPLPAESNTSRATPAQLQAALRRITTRSTERPGSRGLAAGVDDARSPYAEQLSMRQASTFPLAPDAVDEFADDTPEWTPEETYSAYSTWGSYSSDVLDTGPVSTAEDESAMTERILPGDDDEEDEGDWFLGGMFETAEQRRQRLTRDRPTGPPKLPMRRPDASPSTPPPPRPDASPRPSDSPTSGSKSPSPAASGAGATTQRNAAGRGSSADNSGGDDSSSSGAAKGVALAAGAAGVVAGAAAGKKDGGNGSGGDSAAANPSQQTNGRGTGSKASTNGPATPAGRSSTAGTAAAERPPKERASGTAPAARKAGSPNKPGAAKSSAGTPQINKSGSAGGPSTGKSAARGSNTTAGKKSAGASTVSEPRRTSAGTTRVLSPSAAPARPESSPSVGRRGSPKRLLWIVLLVIAAIAIGALIFALLRPGGGGDQVAATSPAAAESPASEPTTEAPAPVVTPEIASVTSLDPDGDGDEKPGDVDKVLPGKSGSWTSETYKGADFGNLKDGLGLRFNLKGKATVTSVTVSSGASGGGFDIRTSDGDDPADAKVVGKGKFSDGKEKVTLDKPTEAEKVFVWITSLPRGGEGFRASVSEVTID